MIQATNNEIPASETPIDTEIEAFFGPNGPLAERLEGYEPRREQALTASAIHRAFLEHRPCIAEAGTGVGKTLAYLVPAVLAALEGKITVISTHTISLQSQLMQKDIPLVLSLFPDDADRVHPQLMKGRANYLCKMELRNSGSNLFLAGDPAVAKIRRWDAKASCTGDVAELPFTFSGWYELVSTPDTCPVQECIYYQQCHYYRMRIAAAQSNIIVVNHALLLSDLAMRLGDPQAGVIPNFDHIVIDEAHHLEEAATRAFGVEFGSNRITGILDKIRHVKGVDLDKDRLKTIETRNAELFTPFLKSGRNEFFLDEILNDEIKADVEAQTGITLNAVSELQKSLLEIAHADENLKERMDGLARVCGRSREELQRLIFEQDAGFVRWGELTHTQRRGKRETHVTLRSTPLSVAPILQQSLWNGGDKPRSITLISATLANSGGFSYIRARLGVPDNAIETVVGSPFDFQKQALLYVPGHLPSPVNGDDRYRELLVDEMVRLIKLIGGRSFLLFTSRAMLNFAGDRLAEKVDFPLFKQGDMPPGQLVEAFKASGNGCLMGVQTFWEGVDVQGDSLSCVIIDRLPFAVPDSPVTKARTQKIKDAGGDWFREFSIPQAQIRLKQGFGRLIRTKQDCGIVCILDSRMINMAYGKEFVRFLPPATRASLWPRVVKFWEGVAKLNTTVESVSDPDISCDTPQLS